MRQLRVIFGAVLVSAVLAGGWYVASGGSGTDASVVRVADRRCRAGCSGSPNLLTKTQDFSNAAWVKTTLTGGSPGAPGGVIAPDGTSTVCLATPGTGATDASVVQSYSTTATGTFTASVWVRTAVGNVASGNLILYLYDDGFADVANTIFTPSSTWQRITVTLSAATAHTFLKVQVGGAATWTEARGAMLLWGAQLQSGNLGVYRPVP